MANVYCDPRVSKKALNKFFASFNVGRDEIHTFSLYDHDTCMIRIAPEPYEPTDKREIYSLSKSFCSTAIGMLVDDGKLSLDDYIIDLFPDECPDEISDNLRSMKLRNVLSMNTGHEACVMNKMIFADDAVKAFLAQPVQYKPGTHFTYNTGATCLLSCIVTKITGETLLDFLTERLFNPLGITEVKWNIVKSGQNEGGCGIHVSNDDIAKLGHLYLHKGVYNGKRYLSEKWVKEASSPISDNSSNGSPDWCSGYGFQFWMNSREGYRGDGACGQLCVVLPEREIVVAVQAELGSMQAEIDALMELIYHLYDKDRETNIFLPLYSPASGKKRTAGIENKIFKLNENPMGWTNLRFEYHADDDSMHVIISDGCEQYNICAGNGKWIKNSIVAKHFKPKLVGLMPAERSEECRFAASYDAEKNHIHMALRYINSPHRMNFDFEYDKDGVLNFYINPSGLLYEGCAVLTGKVR